MQIFIHFLVTTLFIMLFILSLDYVYPVVGFPVLLFLCVAVNATIASKYKHDKDKSAGGTVHEPRLW